MHQHLAVGVLRYESRHRGPALKRLGIITIDNLDERVFEDHQKLFYEAGFDVPVANPPTYVRQIMSSDVRPSLKLSLLGYHACREHGIDPGLSRNTLSDRRRQLDRVLRETPPHDDDAVFLDYETRRLLPASQRKEVVDPLDQVG